MTGTLYIIATPIGNLKDITLRAIETFKSVDLVLSEDTREARKLLSHYEIDRNVLSYHQHSSDAKKLEILKMLLDGKNIALVTDAGTPGIADPGNELVDFLLTANTELKVIPIPGPSSVTAALSVCGFNVSNFTFLGFWPKKKAGKTVKLIKEMELPIVFFESPYRILKTLDLLEKELGEKRIFVGQELTKLHERLLRGTIIEVKAKLEAEKEELGRVKGEIVCVLEF